MSMLPEVAPFQQSHIWVVSNSHGSNDKDVVLATANLCVISYKADEGNGIGYQVIFVYLIL